MQRQRWPGIRRRAAPMQRRGQVPVSRADGRPDLASSTSSSLSSDHAVCLWIPLFPLRCEEWRRPELTGLPTALLSPTDARRLWQVSPLARRMGVRAGVTVSQAIGLCPSLTVIEPDPVRYDETFTQLLLALERVSPVIEPTELGRVFIGVDGLERLYGDPMQQMCIVAHAFGRTAVTDAARLGWARGKFLSWVAATRAKPGVPLVVHDAEAAVFLGKQRVAVLPVSTDTHRRLRQLGIATLADVARLPEPALVSQFGREGRRAWRLATGREVEPVTGRERPEPIVAGLDFPMPAADRLLLAHAIDKLVERALRHPRRSGWRVQTARLHATLEHGSSWTATVILKDPSADRERIVAPLQARLEITPPGGAVEHLVLAFTAFAPGTGELQLFARDADSAARAGRHRALHDAAREIKTRFQQSRLFHIVEVQPWSRIPERRYALIDFEP
jgi:nucleotidyltransferase/DNA polymerase involved in DNA repair